MANYQIDVTGTTASPQSAVLPRPLCDRDTPPLRGRRLVVAQGCPDRSSHLGVAWASMVRSGPQGPAGRTSPAPSPQEEDLMEYVKLGRTGLDVSRLCLGTMGFGKIGRAHV